MATALPDLRDLDRGPPYGTATSGSPLLGRRLMHGIGAQALLGVGVVGVGGAEGSRQLGAGQLT